MATDFVCVGDRLAALDQYDPGSGTYARAGFIYASIVGQQRTSEGASTSGKLLLEVVAQGSLPLVPKQGDVVTAKITRVQQNAAHCNIMCIRSRALNSDFKGVIRVQDVRATEVDKVVLQECFRPGDVVRAAVLSLGDARSYYLTTAKNELGVVYARSAAAGAPMVPVSWVEMQCPESHTIEKRKVASVAKQELDGGKVEA